MIELLVIADDFTGALDTGAQFTKLGIPTGVVCSSTFDVAHHHTDIRALAIDAETRHLCSADAYEITYRITKTALDSGVKTLFKKVDSTLRGQIGSELSAVIDAAGGGELSFVPAFPRTGRTTRDGVHLLYGEPIHNTAFGKDPFEPIRHSGINEIIQKQSDIEVVCVPVGKTPPPLDGERRITVYDAETDVDMRQITESLYNSGQRLLAGCAGLAFPYGELMVRESSSCAPRKTDGMFIVCGSLNPISERQLIYAEQKGFVRMHISLEQKLGDNYLSSGEGRTFLETLFIACTSGKPVMLDVFGEGRPEPSSSVTELGIEGKRVRALVAKRIGEIVRAWSSFGLDQTLVITGGDTLHAFMTAIGHSALQPVCELEPGVVCSVLTDDTRPLQIVSKAGGYGGDDIFMRISDRVLKTSALMTGGI